MRDVFIRRAVILERLKQHQVDKIKPIIKELDKIIVSALVYDDVSALSVREFNALIAGLKVRIDKVLSKYNDQLNKDLIEILQDAYNFELKASGLKGAMTEVKASQVIASSLLITKGLEGKAVADVLAGFNATEQERLLNAVKIGRYQGKTNQQIIQMIRGTRANKFRDGIIGATARVAETLTRTLVQHVAHQGTRAFCEANNIDEYYIIATLDSRTSAICQALDMRVFKLSDNMFPPFHPNCRSKPVPGRPDMDGERSSINGYTKNEPFYAWIKRQPIEFQEQAIGKTKAKLLREGGLDAEQFARLQLDKNFKPITLKEMQKLEPLMFEKAGL